jgi:actin-related protein 4
VLDPGSFTTRAGFAGEDVPKSIVSTHYTFSESKGLQFGEDWLHTPLPDIEVRNPYNSEGLVEDWETAAKVWKHSITSRLIGEPQRVERPQGESDEMEVEKEETEDKPMVANPLLMSEPALQSSKSREKCAEIALDEWGVPAFYLAHSGVLAA